MKSTRTELHLVGPTLFEWDRAKESSNRKKHGIGFIEAATVFEDEAALLFDDPKHSDEEDRFVLVGISSRNRMLTTVHASRGLSIRIISAWPASKEERRLYEEESES